VLTKISHVFYFLMKHRCACQQFHCILSLFAEIKLCRPTFPNSLIIICRIQVCLYYHFPCMLELSAEIKVYLPTLPLSCIIIDRNPVVPTKISLVFYHYLLRSRCACKHFPCILSLLLMSFIIIFSNIGLPANIYLVIYVDSTHGSHAFDLSYVTILFLITQPFTRIWFPSAPDQPAPV